MESSTRDRSSSNMMKAMRVLGLETGVKVERQSNAIDAVEQAAMKILGFPQTSNPSTIANSSEGNQLRGPDDDDDEDDDDGGGSGGDGSGGLQRGKSASSISPRVSSFSKSRISNGEDTDVTEPAHLRNSHYSVWDGGDDGNGIDNNAFLTTDSNSASNSSSNSNSNGIVRPLSNTNLIAQSKNQDVGGKLKKSTNKHGQVPLKDDPHQRVSQSLSQHQKPPDENVGESMLSQLSVRDLQTLKRNNLFLSPDTAKVTVLVVDIALRQNEKNLLAPPFAVYLLRVRCGSRMWSVERRYREFAALHQSLQSVVSISRLPELPGKLAGFGGLMSSFFGPDIERLQQRRIELQAYFSMILRIKEIWHCDDLLMFLDDAKRTLSLQAHFARMVKMTEALAIETYNQNAQNRQLASQLRVANSQVSETRARLNKLAMRLKEQLDEDGLSEAELNEKMDAIMRRSHSSSSTRKDGEGSGGTSLTGSFSIGGPFSGIGSSFDLSSAFPGTTSDQLLALLNPINFSSLPTENIGTGEVEGRQWSGKWDLEERSANTSFTGTEANIWGDAGRLSSFATVKSTESRKSTDGVRHDTRSTDVVDPLQPAPQELVSANSSSSSGGRTSSLSHGKKVSSSEAISSQQLSIHSSSEDTQDNEASVVLTKQRIHAAMSKQQSIYKGQTSNKAHMAELFSKSRTLTHRNSDLVSPVSKQGQSAFETGLNLSSDELASNISAVDASGDTSNAESPSPLKSKPSIKRVPTAEKHLVSDRILTNEFDDVVSVVLGSIASERDRSHNYFGDESSTTSTTLSRRRREKVQSPSTLSSGTPNKAVMHFPPSDASINAQSIMRAFLKLGNDLGSVSGDSSSFFDRLTVSPPGSVRSGTSTRSGKIKKKKQKPATVTFQPWTLELGLGLGGTSVMSSHLSDTTRDSQRDRGHNSHHHSHHDPHDFTSERSGRSDEQQQRSGLSGLIPPAGSISRNRNNNIVATAATPDRQVISTTKRRRAYSESDVDALRRAIDQVVKVMKDRAADSRAEYESEAERNRKAMLAEDDEAAAQLANLYTKEEEKAVSLLVGSLGDASDSRMAAVPPTNNILSARAFLADSDVILAMVNPTRESNRVREEVAMFITNLLRNVAGLEVVPVGAVSSRVYLPDAPLEMSVVIPADMITFSLLPMLQRHLHAKNKNKGGSRQGGPISTNGGPRSDRQNQGFNNIGEPTSNVTLDNPDQSAADPNVVLQEKLRRFALLGMSGERTWFVAANEALCKAAILSGVGRAGTHVHHTSSSTTGPFSSSSLSSSNDAIPTANIADASKDAGAYLKAGTSLSSSVENLRMLFGLQFRSLTAQNAGCNGTSEEVCANLEDRLQQAAEEMEKLIAQLEQKMKEANEKVQGDIESVPSSASATPLPEPASPALLSAISDARSFIKAASSLADTSFTLQESMATIMSISSTVATSVAHQVLRQHTLYAQALRRFVGLVDLSDLEAAGTGTGSESPVPLPLWMYNTRGEPFIMRNLTFSTGDLPWQVSDMGDPGVPFEDLFGGDDDENVDEDEEEDEQEASLSTSYSLKNSSQRGNFKKHEKLSPAEKSRKRKMRLLREAKQRMRDVVAAQGSSEDIVEEDDEGDEVELEEEEEVQDLYEIQNRRFARPSISCLVNNVRVVISAGQRQLHARYQRLPIVNVPVQSKLSTSKSATAAGTLSTSSITEKETLDASGGSGEGQAPSIPTINSLQVMAALTAEATANTVSAGCQEDLSLTVAVDCGTLGASLEIQRVVSLENFATAIDHSTRLARIHENSHDDTADSKTNNNKLVLSVPNSFIAAPVDVDAKILSKDRDCSSVDVIKADNLRASPGTGTLISDSSTVCKVLPRDHIYKRTVLLILAWLRYESESALVRDSSLTSRPDTSDSMQTKSSMLSASKLVCDSYVEPVGLIPRSRRSMQKTNAESTLQSVEFSSSVYQGALDDANDANNEDVDSSVISYQSIEMMVIALFVEAGNFAAAKKSTMDDDHFSSPSLYTWRQFLPSRGFYSSPMEAAFSFCAVFSSIDFSRFVVCSAGIRPLRAFIEHLRSEAVVRKLVASIGRLQAEVEAVALSAGVLNGEIVVRQQNHTLIAVREQHLQSIKQAQEQALSLLSHNAQRQGIIGGGGGAGEIEGGITQSKPLNDGIEISSNGNDLDTGADEAIAAAAAAAASGQSLGLGLTSVKTSTLPLPEALLTSPTGRQTFSDNSSKRVLSKTATPVNDASKQTESSGVSAEGEERSAAAAAAAGDKETIEDDILMIQAATLRLFRKRGLLNKHVAALGRVGMVSQEGVREASINRKLYPIDTPEASRIALPVVAPLPSPNVTISLDATNKAIDGVYCTNIVAQAVRQVAEHNVEACLSAAGATARNLGKKDNIAFYACAYLLDDPTLAADERGLNNEVVESKTSQASGESIEVKTQQQAQLQLPSHSAILSPTFFYNPLVSMRTLPAETSAITDQGSVKSLSLARNVRVRGTLVAPTPGVVMHVTDLCLPHVNATAGVTSKGLYRLRAALAALCRRVVHIEKELEAEATARNAASSSLSNVPSLETAKYQNRLIAPPTRYRATRDLTLFPRVQEFLGGGQRVIGSFAAYRPDLLFHPFQNRGGGFSSKNGGNSPTMNNVLFSAKGVVNSDVIARLLFLDYPSSVDPVLIENMSDSASLSQPFSALDAHHKEALQNAAFSDAISSRHWSVSSISAIFAKVISVRGCSQVSVAGKLVHELPGCGDVGALVRAFLGGLRRLFLRQASSVFSISSTQTIFPLAVCLREHLPLFPHIHVLPKRLLVHSERYQVKANAALQVLHTFAQKQQQQQQQQQQQENDSVSDANACSALAQSLRSYITDDLAEAFETQMSKKSAATRKPAAPVAAEKHRPNEKDRDRETHPNLSRTSAANNVFEVTSGVDDGGGDRMSVVSARGGRGGRGGGGGGGRAAAGGGGGSGGGVSTARGAGRSVDSQSQFGGPNFQTRGASSSASVGGFSHHDSRTSSQRGGRGGVSSTNVYTPRQGLHPPYVDQQFGGQQQFVDPQQQQQMLMTMMLMEQQRQFSALGVSSEFSNVQSHLASPLGYPVMTPQGMPQFGAHDPHSALLLQQQQMMMYNEYLQQHQMAISQSQNHHHHHHHHQVAATSAPLPSPQQPPLSQARASSFVSASNNKNYPSGATLVNGVRVPVYTDAHGTKYVMVDNSNSDVQVGEGPSSSDSAAAREEVKKRVREYGPRR